MPASLRKGMSSGGRRGAREGEGKASEAGRQREQSHSGHHVLGKEVSCEPVVVCAAKKSDLSFRP